MLDWAIAMRPQPGQAVSGDGYVVETFDGGMLLGVIDGLGHGCKAAEASQVALQVLQKRPHEPLIQLIEQCHRATRHTRGSVMSLASVKDTGALTWVGVGNVTALILRNDSTIKPAREHLLVRGGVIGYRMPTLRAFSAQLNAGDVLLFASDGIRSGFLEDIPHKETPQTIADTILTQYGRDTDDATVLVARFG